QILTTLNRIKMKRLTTAILAFTTITTPREKKKKSLNLETRKVERKGYQVAGAHEGTIAIKSEHIEIEGNVLVGDTFVIDMNTISSTYLSGDYKDKLDGHLKSDDFFAVVTYPTSTLVFTKVEAAGENSYKVTGTLTIKKATHPVSFTLNLNDNTA